MARVVVIGAGMGGLAAAARLAAMRHQVTVCEQAPMTGGKLGHLTRDGFAFDTGPSLLTLPAIYRDLFGSTGGPLEEAVELVPTDPVCHYRFADGTEIDMPNISRPRIAAAWDDALGAGAGADWTRLLDRSERIWDATREPFLSSPLDGVRTLLAQARRSATCGRSRRGAACAASAGGTCATRTSAWSSTATPPTPAPTRAAPAALAAIPFVEQSFGAWYVRGGLHRLGRRAAAARVRARRRRPHRLRRRRGAGGRRPRHRGAAGRRRLLPADVVVADADAAHLYRDLVPAPHAAAPLAALRRATPSMSAVVLLLALRGRTPGCATTPCCSPPTTTTSSTRCSAPGRTPRRAAAGARPDRLRQRAGRSGHAPRRAPRGLVRARQRAPARRAGRGVDWDRPGWPTRTPTTSWT
jgi:phytoene dehydrogenase-like protein